MKTVVITGSGKGFGLEMLKCFRKYNYNTVICDINKESIKNAYNELNLIPSEGKIYTYLVDITKEKDVSYMINDLIKCENIDIWINNAGINQPDKAIWDLSLGVINKIIQVDLISTIMCSNLVLKEMIKKQSGQIYNIEGYGSNDAHMLGLSIYGTSKRAVTYFTESLAHEINEKGYKVQIGKLSPGIMITDFIQNADKEKIVLSEKTKKVYNILGDYPDVIAKYMVDKIVKNKKNNVKFTWLTNKKAAFRFMTSSFNKKDYFK